MRDFRDAKAMAQTLRDALKLKSVTLTRSESLELVARVLGFHDWNVLSATIQSEHRPPIAGAGVTMPGDAPVRSGLPALPVRDIVLFPHMIVPLFVGRDTSKRAVEHAMAADKRILTITQKRSGDDNPSADDLYGIGMTVSIIDLTNLADGTVRLIVKSLERAAVVRLVAGEFLAAEIATIEESRGQEAEAFTLANTVLEGVQAHLKINLSLPPYSRLPHLREPGVLADSVAPLLPIPIDRKQDLLETGDVIARLGKILELIKVDKQVA
jgi:uncharacterized protein